MRRRAYDRSSSAARSSKAVEERNAVYPAQPLSIERPAALEVVDGHLAEPGPVIDAVVRLRTK